MNIPAQANRLIEYIRNHLGDEWNGTKAAIHRQAFNVAMLRQRFTYTVYLVQNAFDGGTHKMIFFMFYIQSEISAARIRVPYRRAFSQEIREKYQSLSPYRHFSRIGYKFLHTVLYIEGIAKITELPGKPFKNISAIIRRAT